MSRRVDTDRRAEWPAGRVRLFLKWMAWTHLVLANQMAIGENTVQRWCRNRDPLPPNKQYSRQLTQIRKRAEAVREETFESWLEKQQQNEKQNLWPRRGTT